jgi:hypothetical protein
MVSPATLIVPVRVLPELAATEKFTVPLPTPLEFVVSQLSLLCAVQPQPAVVETANDPVLADEMKIWLEGESE